LFTDFNLKDISGRKGNFNRLVWKRDSLLRHAGKMERRFGEERGLAGGKFLLLHTMRDGRNRRKKAVPPSIYGQPPLKKLSGASHEL